MNPTDAPTPPRRSTLGAWLQLLRVPNLLTVPGDPVAGFCLAWAGSPGITRPYLRMALAATVSLLMYSAGLLFNDWFDLAEDTRDRPQRPLPSGQVKPNTVAITASVLLLAALFVARVAGETTLYVALALAVTVLAYDAYLKRIPAIGPLAMGACRGLSLLVGAAALGFPGLASPYVIVSALGLAAYIASVTQIARGETRTGKVAWYLPSACLLGWLVAVTAVIWLRGGDLMLSHGRGSTVFAVAMGVAAVQTFDLSRSLRGRPDPKRVQATVGSLILWLPYVQAGLVATATTTWTGLLGPVAIVAVVFPAVLLARRFHAS